MSTVENLKNKIRLLNQQLELEQKKQSEHMDKVSKLENERQQNAKKLQDALKKNQDEFTASSRKLQQEGEQLARKIADIIKSVTNEQHELDREMSKQQAEEARKNAANDNQPGKKTGTGLW